MRMSSIFGKPKQAEPKNVNFTGGQILSMREDDTYEKGWHIFVRDPIYFLSPITGEVSKCLCINKKTKEGFTNPGDREWGKNSEWLPQGSIGNTDSLIEFINPNAEDGYPSKSKIVSIINAINENASKWDLNEDQVDEYNAFLERSEAYILRNFEDTNKEKLQSFIDSKRIVYIAPINDVSTSEEKDLAPRPDIGMFDQEYKKETKVEVTTKAKSTVSKITDSKVSNNKDKVGWDGGDSVDVYNDVPPPSQEDEPSVLSSTDDVDSTISGEVFINDDAIPDSVWGGVIQPQAPMDNLVEPADSSLDTDSSENVLILDEGNDENASVNTDNNKSDKKFTNKNTSVLNNDDGVDIPEISFDITSKAIKSAVASIQEKYSDFDFNWNEVDIVLLKSDKWFLNSYMKFPYNEKENIVYMPKFHSIWKNKIEDNGWFLKSHLWLKGKLEWQKRPVV